MCNNCIHQAVCSIYRATGGVKKCENFMEMPKKGRWIKKTADFVYYYACSECEEPVLKSQWGNDFFSDFCPNCGCDMRGAEDGN